MKKLTTLLFAFVLTSSMGFAQNNTASSSQQGVNNVADISQLGASNQSVIEQNLEGSMSKGDNHAVTQQNGVDNVSQVKQTTHQNWISIEQVGDRNVITNSKEFTNPSYSGYAFQRVKNTAVLRQTGDDNTVGLYQNNQKNYALVQQIGSFNEADVWQQSFGGATNGNNAYLTQRGDFNRSAFKQGAGSGDTNNGATIEVTGSYNGNAGIGGVGDDWMTIEQTGRFNKASVIIEDGDYNDADVSQDGKRNKAQVHQGPYATDYNRSDIIQKGGDNEASFRIKGGNDNQTDISQEGYDNYVNYSIAHGNENVASFNQLGDLNRSKFELTNDGAWNGPSSGNMLTLDVDGLRNFASGRVTGDDNSIALNQQGDHNRIGTSWYTMDGVHINGNANSITVDQLSNANNASTTISGNNNSSTIMQN